MYCWKSGAGVPHFQGLAREVGEPWGFACVTEDSKVLHQHWKSTSCSSLAFSVRQAVSFSVTLLDINGALVEDDVGSTSVNCN